MAAMLMLYPDDIPGLEVTPNARNDTMGCLPLSPFSGLGVADTIMRHS